MKNIIIEMKNIRKEFSNILAVDNIDLIIEENEIHAIIGENGAGKTTLMSILFGHLKSTQGEIYIRGKRRNYSGPNEAFQDGLGMVHQHFKLVETYTVLENIVLGNEPLIWNTFISLKNARHRLISISKKYSLEINPDLLIKNATVGEQQRTEILKILYKDAKILIFDEPTAVLTPNEIDGFLKTLLEFKKLGKTIIIITHKLDEVKKVADRATIIRKGKKVSEVDVKKTSIDMMAELMVGRKIVSKQNKASISNEKAILDIKNLNVPHRDKKGILGLKEFSLKIRAGEIVAIAGVEGNGQVELANAIYGLSLVKSGTIQVNNKNILKKSIKQRNKIGISYIPEDRIKYAIIEGMSVSNNFILKEYSNIPYSKFGIMNNIMKSFKSNIIINKYDIRGSDGGNSLMSSLSGGNQQKMVVGREMESNHDLIIIFQPTRGLDVGAIEFVHEKIIEQKLEGKAVLLISYELNEVMSLADRIVILNSGEKIGEVFNNKISRKEIGLMMAGIKNQEKNIWCD